MTIADIEKSDKDILIPSDIAEILGVHHYSINVQAQADPSKLGFPVIVVKRRVKIPRIGFLNWFYHRPEGVSRDR